MKHIRLASLMLMQFIAAASLAAADVCFTYASPDGATGYYGSKLKENYDVAIAIPGSSMAGMKITSIEVPVQASGKVANLSFWVAKSLELETVEGVKVNKVDQSWPMEMPATGGLSTLRLDIPQGYIVPEEGLYVGYSFSVTALDGTNATTKPVVVTAKHGDNGFFLHSSRSYRSWENHSAKANASTQIKVMLQGEIAEAAASVVSVGEHYLAPNAENQITVPVANTGMEAISSIGYKATVGSAEHEKEITLAKPIYAIYGWEEQLAFTLPATSEPGDATTTIEITKVNGKQCGSSASSTCRVLSFVPKKLALMEEYTGCWCGWCPRGFVAMEKMSKLNPDFVGIAYHDGDPMEMAGGYPQMPLGFPVAFLNRVFSCDPFHAADKSSAFTMPKVYAQYCAGLTPAEIAVEASIDGQGIVKATATCRWAAMPFTHNYKIEYALLADDLHSESDEWNQTNYYSGKDPQANPGMEEFCEADHYVSDLHYNDVAIMTSGLSGVEGSVAEISTEQPTVHTFTFNTSEALNAQGNPILFDPNKLRVVAILLEDNGQYGIVENATKCKVENLSGVEGVMADRQVETVNYYDLQGRAITNPGNGMCVRITRYTDGSINADKIIK